MGHQAVHSPEVCCGTLDLQAVNEVWSMEGETCRVLEDGIEAVADKAIFRMQNHVFHNCNTLLICYLLGEKDRYDLAKQYIPKEIGL